VQTVDYSGMAEAYARLREVHPGIVQRLAERTSANSRVLEVGCGTGNYLAAVTAQSGCDAIGLDPEAAMLERLRERNPTLRSRVGRAEALDFPDASFDLVYSVDVIHHIRDHALSYSEAARVLRPKGLICTVTDSEEVIRTREPLAKYFPEIIDIELRRYPSIGQLRDYMEASGFSEIREELIEHSFFFTDASPIRERVFSCLRLLDDDVFSDGLARLDMDLSRGPVRCVWRYVLVWGAKQ
jgi:ubiquinone/menaquinone biosynthesis C-methylase UbiE